MTLAKILSRSILQPNGCLLFEPHAYGPPNRYANISLPDGRRRGAHKAVWILSKGEVPEGLEVCHKCDQPRCVNIEHLFLATHSRNMQDRDAKGRNGTLGENSPLHKLTAEQVLEIHGKIGIGIRFNLIASDYGISLQTVTRIAQGTTWKHILPRTHAQKEAQAV